MDKSIKHVGVLGMHWGFRKGSDPVTMGGRTTTRAEHRDEAAKRQLALTISKNPHMERKEADLIMNRAGRESSKNLDKALNRYGAENSLRSAIKKGYIKAPSKNVMEMSTKEIEHHLNSDPSINVNLQKDFDAKIKRGKIIAGTVIAGYAAIQIGTIIMNTKMAQNAATAMMNASLKMPMP
jgi:hypothetical protein